MYWVSQQVLDVKLFSETPEISNLRQIGILNLLLKIRQTEVRYNTT